MYNIKMAPSVTSIQITPDTRDRLKRYGIKDETYDSILNKLMDACDATSTTKPNK
jgi:hypothetical protein